MNRDLFDALEALCYMWDQYCGDKWGHMCMSAGEHTEEVLDKHNLLIHKQGYEAAADYQKLEELRKTII